MAEPGCDRGRHSRGRRHRGTFAVRSYARVPATGMLVVNTNPGGVQVFIDGKKRGMTPLTLELPTGDHKLELTLGDQTRAFP